MTISKWLFAGILTIFGWSLPLRAQNPSLSTYGKITLQTSSCSGAGAGYVYLVLPPTASAYAATISGTWVGTLQFVGSVNGSTWVSVSAQPIPSGSPVTSTTSNGTWTINPAGLTQICVYASSYTSGAAVIAASVATAGLDAVGAAGGDLGGSFPDPTVTGLNGNPLPANSFGVLTNSGSGALAYVPPFAVDVTQPPYSAKCDGSTDDHVAIQAALDQNAAIMIPVGPSPPTQCNLGTVGITLCSASNLFGYNAIYGNGQIFNYAGTGSGVTTSSNCTASLIRDLGIYQTSATGTPALFDIEGPNTELDNDVEQGNTLPNGGYTSILINAPIAKVANYYGNGFVVVNGTSGNVVLQSTDVDSYQLTGVVNVQLIAGSAENSNGSISDIEFAVAIGISGTSFAGGVTIHNSAVSTSGADFYSSITLQTDDGLSSNLSGNALTRTSTPLIVSGTPVLGNINISSDYSVAAGFWQYTNGIQTNILYSVAGTPLPTCGASTTGVQLQVSDATIPTFLGTYTGGSTVQSPVVCNGTNWVTY